MLQLFQMQAKMTMDKCYIFDWWVKREALISLVMGKSRVALSKVVSIPRLELTAAALSFKVSILLRKKLTIHPIINEYFYTNSQVVLKYLNSN